MNVDASGRQQCALSMLTRLAGAAHQQLCVDRMRVSSAKTTLGIIFLRTKSVTPGTRRESSSCITLKVRFI
jgi:hypothetical protein